VKRRYRFGADYFWQRFYRLAPKKNGQFIWPIVVQDKIFADWLEQDLAKQSEVIKDRMRSSGKLD
jgi:hypothetical protein